MVTYILFKLECRASHYDVIVVEQATMTSLFSLQGRIRFDSFFCLKNQPRCASSPEVTNYSEKPGFEFRRIPRLKKVRVGESLREDARMCECASVRVWECVCVRVDLRE